MKKISSLLFLVLFCISGYAKEVTVQTARTVGFNYLTQKGFTEQTKPDDLSLIYTSTSGSKKAFYVFGAAHSFVIVAAEDNVKPVLGYSLHNEFKANGIPEHVAGFLNGYTEQITYVQANKVAATETIENTWNDLINNVKIQGVAAKTTAVSAMLSTTWDQSPYYNDYCPYDSRGGGRSVTGCVATAMAQVMKFHSWPNTGVGFHSYSTSSYGTLSANFSSRTYNWSAMPASVTSTNAAVAQLMSDVGISVDMSYSASSSGAYVISAASSSTNCAEYALKTYFKYDASLRGYLRSSYSDATWISMLESDLNARRPIIYAGFGSGGGHCFVFDGYDASDNFHVNWGWGGAYDGYFAIDALNPSGTGTGGGSGGYNSGQQAILGVKPNSTSSSSGADTLALYDYVTLSATTINYAAAFSVSTDVGNFGTYSFSGDLGVAAFDAAGNFVCMVDSIMSSSLGTLSAGFHTGTVTFSTSGLLALIPGTYYIGIYYRPPGGGWSAVWDYGTIYTNFVTLNVVNRNPVQLYAAMTPSSSSFTQGSPGSVTLKLRNFMSTTFSGSYDVSLYNLDGTFNSTIQNMTGMSLAAGATTPTLTFSTSSITAAPGTYILATQYGSSAWYLAGADYYTNPIYITVVAPPPSPDIYEVNNTAATAYNLPLTFSGSTAAASTPGANFHTTSDQDYYKVTLAAGYNYVFDVRVNDELSSDDAGSYSTDATWTYSSDGGTTWSAVYTDVRSGTFTVNAATSSASVIFKVSQALAGNLGNYMLKIRSVTRTPVSIADLAKDAVNIYPNPAADVIQVDLAQIKGVVNSISLTDVAGKKVYTTEAAGQNQVKIPVYSLAAGSYFIEISTSIGVIRQQVSVAR